MGSDVIKFTIRTFVNFISGAYHFSKSINHLTFLEKTVLNQGGKFAQTTNTKSNVNYLIENNK